MSSRVFALDTSTVVLTDAGFRISDGWAERLGQHLGAEERGTVARRMLPNPARQPGFKTTEQMRAAAARGGQANAKKHRKLRA